MKSTPFFILLLTIGISCTMEVSTESDYDLLVQTLDKFNSAFEKCDIQVLDLLTTEQYAHLNGSNSAITKKDWMAYLSRRRKQLDESRLILSKYIFEEKQIQIYKNSAFVTGVILMDGSLDETAFSRKIRVSHFWVKEDGQWKRAGFHDVRIE